MDKRLLTVIVMAVTVALVITAIFYQKWGIHLTQVTPRCSMWLRGGLPARFA